MSERISLNLNQLSLGYRMPTDAEMPYQTRPQSAQGRTVASLGRQLWAAIEDGDDETVIGLLNQAPVEARLAGLSETFGPHCTPLLVAVADRV